MKTTLFACLSVLVVALSIPSAHAADRAAADSLAMSGAALAAKGSIAPAKDMLYKALANDENCPDAIYELAKIFDKENATGAAGDFYQRALILMAQENKPTTTAKRSECDRRVKALNPFAPRLSAIFEDYAQDLDRLVKKVPDTLTQDTALARVGELKMATIITAEKLPKFYATAVAAKTAAAAVAMAETKKPKRSSSGFSVEELPAKVVTVVSPEIERELKAMGWTTITGTWTKKSTGVYEVTDGKLEAPKINGGVDLWVQKLTGTAAVRAAVRNDFSGSNSDFTYTGSSSSSSYYYSAHDYAGYGITIRPKEFRLYGPGVMTGFYSSSGGGRMEPSHIRSENLVDSNPKNHVYVTILDNVLELSVNDKKSLRYSNKNMPTAGPFVIEVRGTAVIENPRCAGQ